MQLLETEGEEEGLGWSSNLNPVFKVSTCQHLVWTGMVRSHSQHKGFPPVWKPLVCKANFKPIICWLLTSSPPFLLSVSQTVWKNREGMAEGKSDISFFDTAHVCLFKNSLACQLGPVSIDEASVTSRTGSTRVSRCLLAGGLLNGGL